MRPLFILLVFTAFASTASASDHHWTMAFAQGTFEAIIRNETGASLNIYCPSGQTDATPGMFLESKKLHPRKGEQIEVQIIVGARKYPFRFDEIQFRATGQEGVTALSSLIEGLVKSNRKTFTVEFSPSGNSEIFSVRGAKKAFVSPGEFLSGCEQS